jgi:hypothetical protein
MSALKSAWLQASQFVAQLPIAGPEERVRMRAAAEQALQRLSESPDYWALVALLMETRGDYARAAAQQSLAAHQGSLQHCAGSLYAVDGILDLHLQACVPASRKQARRRQEVDPDKE